MPERPEKLKLNLPGNVRQESASVGNTLNQMLIDSNIDAFIGPRPPRCFAEGHQNARRRIENSVDAVSEWYRETGIFPITHLLGVRRSLADERPSLPGALFKAFSEAKDVAIEALRDTSSSTVTIPFVENTLVSTYELLRRDDWPYVFENNRKALETFCDMHCGQALSARKLEPAELFHPSTLESYSL